MLQDFSFSQEFLTSNNPFDTNDNIDSWFSNFTIDSLLLLVICLALLIEIMYGCTILYLYDLAPVLTLTMTLCKGCAVVTLIKNK